SAELGSWAPHVNFGITLPPRELLTNLMFPFTGRGLNIREVDYSAGVDFVPGPRLTLTGDMVGRTKRYQPRYGYIFDSDDGGKSFFTLLNTGEDPLTQILGSFGAKLNVRGTLLLTATALFPLNSSGLASHVATVVGFDYGF